MRVLCPPGERKEREAWRAETGKEREESRGASRGGARSEALLGTLPWMIAPV